MSIVVFVKAPAFYLILILASGFFTIACVSRAQPCTVSFTARGGDQISVMILDAYFALSD